MSRSKRILLVLALAALLAIVVVLLFGSEYRDETREFLRNLIRAL